ncbi:MAG: hypothetical protein C4522_02710 [Desulfobacteraceae bacterium]|nr:MAG: hypothetical protein C4522_02710 [Desulfobacteraceae bacterium]
METPFTHITAAQIKEKSGKSIQSIHKKLKKLKCPFRLVQGRGKPCKEYLFCGLPGEIQNILLSKKNGKTKNEQESANPSKNTSTEIKPVNINFLISATDNPEKKEPWHSLPDSQKDKGFALLKIVNHARDIHSATKKGKIKQLKKYAHKEGASLPSLLRYMKQANTALALSKETNQDPIFAQIKALTPKYGKNKDKFRAFDQDAIAYACGLYLNQKHLNITDIYKETMNAGRAEGWRTGSYDSLRDILLRIDSATTTLARKGKKRFEADHMVKILRNYNEIWPNFMWCGDHHIFDVFVKLPDGKGGWKFLRPWLTAWMDMRSRSFMGWVISFNPNSRCIAMALAHGISCKNDPNFPQHGKPDSVYIDNGKDYRCKYLNGEEVKIGTIDYPAIIEKYAALGIDPFYIDLEYDPEQGVWIKKRGQKEIVIKGVRVGGVFGKLNVNRRYATAYHPWAKPIERAFRNVVQSFSRNLPGWCGSGHEQRPEKLNFELKRGTVLTSDEFCRSFYDWVVNVYHKTPHRGNGMNNMTPDQVFTSLMPYPKTIDPQLLDFALMKKERVKIYNWGFTLNGRDFELDLPINLEGGYLANKMIGEFASIRFDYDHKNIRVYKNGEYICNGKPLNRASFITEDDSAMIEKLKLQSYQKKVSKGILRAIGVHSEKETVAREALLQISREEDSLDYAMPDDDSLFPINEDERYRMILNKLATGITLSTVEAEFMNEFQTSEEYLSSQSLYENEFEYAKYRHQKTGVAS